MNYYYDIVLNWSEEAPFMFYEWNDTDYLEYIKKIPIFKVKHKTLVDFCSHKVVVTPEFLASILDKTILSSKGAIKTITYAALISDAKNAIAVEFNEKGESISYSTLMIDDELNILDIIYTLKETNLNYEILRPLKINDTLRQVREARKFIELELNELYQNKEIDKLKYYYYEYKQEQTDDIEVIYHKLLEETLHNFNQNTLKLYYIIKLSYHNV